MVKPTMLADAVSERIDDDRTPRRISESLANRLDSIAPVDMDMQRIDAGRMSHHSHYGGESDGLAATVRTCFDLNTWSEIAARTDYMPSNIPDAVLQNVAAIAESDPEPFRHIGRMLAVIGERYARVATEKALEEHFDDAEVAAVSRETENVDMTCAAGDVQVYTGSSDKYWYNKSNAPECSKRKSEMDHETAVEQTNFDVFVFVRIIEGTLWVGAKTIANDDETSAPTKAKP